MILLLTMVEEVDVSGLDVLKEEYGKFSSRHELPDFRELNELFEGRSSVTEGAVRSTV